MRRPVSIAAAMSSEGFEKVFALCDDGSTWELALSSVEGEGEYTWVEHAPIPGSKRDEDEE